MKINPSLGAMVQQEEEEEEVEAEQRRLHASTQTIETLNAREYWLQLCPFLTIHNDETEVAGLKEPVHFSEEALAAAKESVIRNGFVQLKAVPFTVDLSLVARGIERLIHFGWDPLFIAVYNEPWVMAQQLSEAVKVITGGNELNLDFLAWSIDPRLGQKGFGHHRDRQPQDIPASFRLDGTSKYSSIWIALNSATPANSCLYCIPRQNDPGYIAGDQQKDPLLAVCSQPGGYESIQALPCSPGDVLVFTHRLIHWGSAGLASHCAAPRVAIGYACSDDSFEVPYFQRSHLPLPALRLRVALCSAQAIEYHKRLQFSPSQLALFNRIFCRLKAEFDAHYVQKIRGEFEWSKFVSRNTRMARQPQRSQRKRCAKPSSNNGVVSVVNEQVLAGIAGLFLD